MRAKINEIISKYKYDLFGRKNVVGMGLGFKKVNGFKTAERSVVVLVKRKLPDKELTRDDIIPQLIHGVKTDVIEVGELHFSNIRTERLRPVQPGVSIGHYKISAGTLGAVVKDKKTGEPLLLSNNHVLANITNGMDGRSQKNDPILQPGVYDGGTEENDLIGRLERFIPLRRGGETECPIARNFERLLNSFIYALKPRYVVKLYKKGVENTVDCAVARPVNKKMIDKRILEIGEIKGTTSPEVGMAVKKSGRTTGLTRGKIELVDATVEVQMSESESAIFSDQFITGPISSAGDSGSLILDSENNAVGLLFAGSKKATICNNIENVCNNLDIEF